MRYIMARPSPPRSEIPKEAFLAIRLSVREVKSTHGLTEDEIQEILDSLKEEPRQEPQETLATRGFGHRVRQKKLKNPLIAAAEQTWGR